MTTEVQPQDFELSVRITGKREDADALAEQFTTAAVPFSGSVLVQPVEDTPETPDHTTLLVPSDALSQVRDHVTTMTTSDPYSEAYENALARLLPAMHRLLGIVTETTPEAVAAAPAEPIRADW